VKAVKTPVDGNQSVSYIANAVDPVPRPSPKTMFGLTIKNILPDGFVLNVIVFCDPATAVLIGLVCGIRFPRYFSGMMNWLKKFRDTPSIAKASLLYVVSLLTKTSLYLFV